MQSSFGIWPDCVGHNRREGELFGLELHVMTARQIFSATATLGVVLAFTLASNDADAATNRKCLFVSSYHQGYAWSDGVERGLRSVLDRHCEIKQFDMDTKRHKSKDEIKASALRAKALIESWQPDIVIAADDNAAKHLIVPYYKDHALPFVFCAVNWTADEYGFPYSNVTGMLEVAPIQPSLARALQIVPNLRRVFYLGADTLTESKNLKRYQDAASSLGLEVTHALANSTEAWLAAYETAQDYDLVVLGSNAGINDWDPDKVRAGVLRHTRKLSVTNMEWMMPFTILGLTKVPEEQGEWAAKAAISILSGTPPSAIPIVSNSRRDIWVNTGILAASGLTLPDEIMRKGKKVDVPPPQSAAN